MPPGRIFSLNRQVMIAALKGCGKARDLIEMLGSDGARSLKMVPIGEINQLLPTAEAQPALHLQVALFHYAKTL